MPYKDKEVNKAYHKKWAAARRESRKEYVNEYKHRMGCLYCDENEPVALDFHHVSGEKEGEISFLSGGTRDFKKLEREIAKCIVVCANCHRKIHAGIL